MTWATTGEVGGLGPRRRHGRATPPRSPPCWRSPTRRRIPVTAAAGRSGVCGASVPVHGGVVLDLTQLSGIVDVDDTSLVVDVLAGTFGNLLEDELRGSHGLTRRPLAAIDRPVDRRRLARLPQRRPVLESLRQDRGHGRRPRRGARRRHGRAHRRRPRQAVGPRSQPAVRRQRGHARRDHRCSPAASTTCPRTRRPRPTASTASPPRSMRCAAGSGEAPRRRCCASTTPRG